VEAATLFRQSSWATSDGSEDIVEINVGGELLLLVERSTLLLSPKGSLLQGLCGKHTGEDLGLHLDRQGRMFLDFPPQPFRRIIDHLRLLKVTPEDELLPPPACRGDVEFQALVRLLGLQEFLLKQPQAGKAEPRRGKCLTGDKKPPRVVPLCPSRRGHDAPVLCAIS